MWALGAAGALTAAFAFAPVSLADLPGGCDFAPTGTTASCLGPLSPSTFAGGDGNLLTSPTTYGTTDWETVSGLNKGIDLASGSGDNSFGQGTKEDGPNVSVVSGSIPPNKSDLIRFYEASEFISSNSHNYLYLAWERTNVLGNANMDFEIDAATNASLGSPGPHTIDRTAGDLLVTYDFTNGGGRPIIGLNRWLVSATNPTVPGFSTNVCFSSNTFPCWGDHKILDGTDSIAAVNNLDAVTDPIAPDAGRSLAALTFGETAIDLTAAGVFSTSTCSALGSTFLKSRASSSFTAEVKDFVAPVPVNISNCGSVTIIKHSDPRGLNQDFSYTSTIPNPTGTVTTTSTPYCQLDTSPSSFTLNDNGNTTADSAANTEDCTNVPAGSYTVTEGAEPAGFTLEGLSCTATTGSSGSQDATNHFQANITIVPNGHVTCTYVNKGSGAILVTKTAKNHNLTSGPHPLAGATFTVNGVTKTTDANGQACFDGLAIGTAYTVTETSAPTGYAIDTASKSVTPSASASCSSGTPDGVSFTDSPLTDLMVKATAEVLGVTNTSIKCVVGTGTTDIGNSPQGPSDPAEVDANGLKPGTYTCTIVVDP